jgi:hypothetical protein
MRIAIGALAVCLGGCVQQADLAAWPGVSIRELQTHAFFSSLPKRVEVLGDGEELWTYSNCAATTEPVTCNPVGSSMVCTGGDTDRVCCHNQFFVKNGAVESYRPVGRCRTDCSVRPGGRCGYVAARPAAAVAATVAAPPPKGCPDPAAMAKVDPALFPDCTPAP